MSPKSSIASVLILGGVFTGGYFLGARSRNEEVRALEADAKSLASRNREQSELLADRYAGLSWETLEQMDPITRKHMIVQMWYASQDAGNYFLGRDMGHDWGPRWNRRSALLILEEQTEVMREFLNGLRELEEASLHPPKYPTEDHRDPADGSRIDWENFIEIGDEANPGAIWYGKSRERGDWMAYEHEKGVYKPDSALLGRIVDHKRAEEAKADPFFEGE